MVRAALGAGLVVVGAKFGGLNGVALGHLMASVIGVSAFLWAVHRYSIPFRLRDYALNTFPMPSAVMGLGVGAVAALWSPTPLSLVESVVGASTATLALGLMAWTWLLDDEDRVRLNHMFRRPSASQETTGRKDS